MERIRHSADGRDLKAVFLDRLDRTQVERPVEVIRLDMDGGGCRIDAVHSLLGAAFQTRRETGGDSSRCCGALGTSYRKRRQQEHRAGEHPVSHALAYRD